MANRFPLIVDSSALQIKELPASDNLDLANSSIVNVVDITTTGNITIGGTLTYEDVTNVDSIGIVTAGKGIVVEEGGVRVVSGGATIIGVVTATSFIGNLNASNLNSGTIPDARFPNPLPAISGENLTGLPAAGVGIRSDGTTIGFGVTFLNFTGSGIGTVTTDATTGIGTIVVTGGGGGGGGGGTISTDAQVKTNGQTALLDLANAQDHKITCTGTVTISCTGGTEGDSHTVRIVNSGTATVGFSTYFLFPSGATPSLPTSSGDISLISFTVHRGGAAGISTQLLAGASLNFS